MSRPLRPQMIVESTLCSLAKAGWRSKRMSDTVAHRVLEGCRSGSLKEDQTVKLLEAVLAVDSSLLTVRNARGRSPTDIAMACTHCPEVERLFTVVVFDRYQIVRPGQPMYKSHTAVVHEVVDLAPHASSHPEDPEPLGHAAPLSGPAGDGSDSSFRTEEGRLALKLVAAPHLWQREIRIRCQLAVAGGSIVSVVSAAVAMPSQSGGRSGADHGQGRNCDHDIEADHDHDDVRHFAGLMANSSPKLEVTVLESTATATVRREEARAMMATFPYALCMPLADRNLAEIISSERLAEEPLQVIRTVGRKVSCWGQERTVPPCPTCPREHCVRMRHGPCSCDP